MFASAPLERRVLAAGLKILAATTGWFIVFKLLMANSVVVHQEKASIHRVFFGGFTLRFPQEAFNLVDFLTTAFLFAAGTFALIVAFCVPERIAASKDSFAKTLRGFFRLAGFGFFWLGLDEIFLVHEFASANLYVDDTIFLAAYAAIGLVACARWLRVLLSNQTALATLLVGAACHGAALGMDLVQNDFSWLPEEPFEMLAAGFYAIGIAIYAARILAGPKTAAETALTPLPGAIPGDPHWAR